MVSGAVDGSPPRRGCPQDTPRSLPYTCDDAQEQCDGLWRIDVCMQAAKWNVFWHMQMHVAACCVGAIGPLLHSSRLPSICINLLFACRARSCSQDFSLREADLREPSQHSVCCLSCRITFLSRRAWSQYPVRRLPFDGRLQGTCASRRRSSPGFIGWCCREQQLKAMSIQD